MIGAILEMIVKCFCLFNLLLMAPIHLRPVPPSPIDMSPHRSGLQIIIHACTLGEPLIKSLNLDPLIHYFF